MDASEYKGKEMGKQLCSEKQTNYGSTVKRLLYYYNIKASCEFSSEALLVFSPLENAPLSQQDQISSKVLMTFCWKTGKLFARAPACILSLYPRPRAGWQHCPLPGVMADPVSLTTPKSFPLLDNARGGGVQREVCNKVTIGVYLKNFN